MTNETSTQAFYEEFHAGGPVQRANLVTQFMQKERCSYIRSLMSEYDGHVLVIGCGSGDDMSVVNRRCIAVGIDISETAIAASKSKYPQHQYYVADATNLPFPQNTFDSVLCSEVIEHISHEEKALLEVRRVLKNRGLFIVTTPNWFCLYGLARKLAEAILRRPFTAGSQPIDRWSTPFSLIGKLKQRGFEVLKLRGIWYYPPTGRGRRQIPAQLILPIIRITYPLDLLFRKIFPWFGHMLLFEARARKSEE